MRESRELRALQKRVEGWRRVGGGKGSRIPEGIWQEAVALSRTEGVWATSRALRFNYERLKKASFAMTPPAPTTKFVALEMPPMVNGLQVVVELAGADGEQMRMHVTGASTADVILLTATFWRRRA
jgi:hypothetical protein